MKFTDLFKKLLFLDSIALSANIEVLVADEDTCEELVETRGAGAQSLVNLLHAVCLPVVCTPCYINMSIQSQRLDFPIGSAHKRLLLVRALSRLSEASDVYPESLTLTDVTPERGRRAAGGFADVYKGTCLGEDIALKVLKYSLPFGVDSLDSWTRSSDNHFKNLLREVMTWRQLSHPNVLPFYGIYFLEDTLETRFCLVSPWMEHGNVVEFLARQNHMASHADAPDCVSLVRTIISGIAFVMVALSLSRHLISPMAFSISMVRRSFTGI